MRWKLCIYHRIARMKVNVDVGHQVPLPTVNNMKQLNKVWKEWFSSKGKIC